MKNRYRVEIYDENKANDLTIYSEQGVDKEYLTELVFSNMRKFDGNIRAYVYDNLKKKNRSRKWRSCFRSPWCTCLAQPCKSHLYTR